MNPLSLVLLISAVAVHQVQAVDQTFTFDCSKSVLEDICKADC